MRTFLGLEVLFAETCGIHVTAECVSMPVHTLTTAIATVNTAANAIAISPATAAAATTATATAAPTALRHRGGGGSKRGCG